MYRLVLHTYILLLFSTTHLCNAAFSKEPPSDLYVNETKMLPIFNFIRYREYKNEGGRTMTPKKL